MPNFQLDECLNDADFARLCVNEAEAKKISGINVNLLPDSLHGEDDDIVLAQLMKRDGTLLTKDRKIASEHSNAIPNSNPGIVIIANAPGSVRTMSVKQVEKILSEFKSNYTEWHALSFKNSIIEISQIGIEIWHVSDGKLIHDRFVAFSEQTDYIGKEKDVGKKWDELLVVALTENTNRN